tara:strand:- start:337 stop:489 length:153 start_codon:yes stop_codon:yes gene_type:complete
VLGDSLTGSWAGLPKQQTKTAAITNRALIITHQERKKREPDGLARVCDRF